MSTTTTAPVMITYIAGIRDADSNFARTEPTTIDGALAHFRSHLAYCANNGSSFEFDSIITGMHTAEAAVTADFGDGTETLDLFIAPEDSPVNTALMAIQSLVDAGWDPIEGGLASWDEGSDVSSALDALPAETQEWDANGDLVLETWALPGMHVTRHTYPSTGHSEALAIEWLRIDD